MIFFLLNGKNKLKTLNLFVYFGSQKFLNVNKKKLYFFIFKIEKKEVKKSKA